MGATPLGYPYPERDDPTSALRTTMQELAEAMEAAPGILHLTTTQRNDLAGGGESSALREGLHIWNLDTKTVEYWDGAGWRNGNVASHNLLSGRDALDAHNQYLLTNSFNQHLTESNPHTGYVRNALFIQKGMLIAGIGASTPVGFGIGPPGTALVADPAASTGMSWKRPSSIGWALHKEGNQSIAGAEVDEVLDFQIEDADPYNFHNSIAPGRVTVPTGYAGWYEVSAGVQWGATAGASGYVHISIRKNNTPEAKARVPGVSSAQSNLNVSRRMYLGVGDYVQIWAKQNAGVARDVEGSDLASTWCTGSFQGPA